MEKVDRLNRPAQNRSLERGISILRAFRAGAGVMGNSELAERTGLSTATVSRLTQTLVKTGMLDYDSRERAYRLSAAVLSLGHAVTFGSPILGLATPHMRQLAEERKVNIGIATRDGDEMVYLEVIRFNRRASHRSVVAGHRVPIESTSLGRAYLATLSIADRRTQLKALAHKHASEWTSLKEDIQRSVEMVKDLGYCTVDSWQPGAIALATPLRFKHHPIHVLNVSISTQEREPATVRELAQELMNIAATIAAGES